MKGCKTTGCLGRAVIGGECRACYVYRRRHQGRSRAALLADRAAQKGTSVEIMAAIQQTESRQIGALVRRINGGQPLEIG